MMGYGPLRPGPPGTNHEETPMPDTPSITIIKRFKYRGKDEEWSNSYHFSGSTPSSDAGWKTLFDAVIAEEKKCYTSMCKVVRAYGYEAGNEHSVAQVDYAAAPLTPIEGTFTLVGSGSYIQAGDAAAWIRARTPNKNSRGKWIYIRKYMHNVYANQDGLLAPDQKTAMEAFGAKLVSGTLPGNFKWVAPQGAEGGPIAVSAYVTTRTLKRRGKRPSS